MHTKHVLSFTRSIANVLRAQAVDLRIYYVVRVSRDTNKGPQNQSSKKKTKVYVYV